MPFDVRNNKRTNRNHFPTCTFNHLQRLFGQCTPYALSTHGFGHFSMGEKQNVLFRNTVFQHGEFAIFFQFKPIECGVVDYGHYSSLKFSLLWVPSQNGLLCELPQRHKAVTFSRCSTRPSLWVISINPFTSNGLLMQTWIAVCKDKLSEVSAFSFSFTK